jgi:hypothetical protein
VLADASAAEVVLVSDAVAAAVAALQSC